MNLDHLKLTLQEFEKRFSEANDEYRNIDDKARWVFGLLLTAVLATAGFLLANQQILEICRLALVALLFFEGLGLYFAGLAISLRQYRGSGTTPSNMQMAEWKPFLTGGPTELIQFYTMKVKRLASVIAINEASNKVKSNHLKWAIWSALASIVVAVAIVASEVWSIDQGACASQFQPPPNSQPNPEDGQS